MSRFLLLAALVTGTTVQAQDLEIPTRPYDGVPTFEAFPATVYAGTIRAPRCAGELAEYSYGDCGSLNASLRRSAAQGPQFGGRYITVETGDGDGVGYLADLSTGTARLAYWPKDGLTTRTQPNSNLLILGSDEEVISRIQSCDHLARTIPYTSSTTETYLQDGCDDSNLQTSYFVWEADKFVQLVPNDQNHVIRAIPQNSEYEFQYDTSHVFMNDYGKWEVVVSDLNKHMMYTYEGDTTWFDKSFRESSIISGLGGENIFTTPASDDPMDSWYFLFKVETSSYVYSVLWNAHTGLQRTMTYDPSTREVSLDRGRDICSTTDRVELIYNVYLANAMQVIVPCIETRMSQGY